MTSTADDEIIPMGVVVDAQDRSVADRNVATKKTSKVKSKVKRSAGDILELATDDEKKKLSHKFRHNSEDVELKLR